MPFNTSLKAKEKLYLFPKYFEVYSPSCRLKKKKSNFLPQSIRITENYHLEFLLSGEATSFIPAHYVKGEIDVGKA